MPPFAQFLRQTQILILKILNVFGPAPWNAKPIPLGRLKFSPSLDLNKIERFSKVSMMAAIFLLLQSGGAHAANLKYVRTAKHQNFTRIVFEFQNATQFKEPVIYGEGKLSVAFPDSTTVLPRRILYKTTQIQPVRSIEFTQKETLLTAVIQLSFSDFKLKAFSLPDPNRVVIDAYKITPPPSEIVTEESLHAEPVAKESKEPETKNLKAMPEKSPAKEFTRVVRKEPMVIPEKSSVKQTADKFEIKRNAASDITRDQLKDPAKKSLKQTPDAPLETPSAPEEPLPSTHGNYTLQTYMLILLNFLTIVIVLLLCFNLMKKKSGIHSKHDHKISDSLKTDDERIAAIDGMINREFKKHD